MVSHIQTGSPVRESTYRNDAADFVPSLAFPSKLIPDCWLHEAKNTELVSITSISVTQFITMSSICRCFVCFSTETLTIQLKTAIHIFTQAFQNLTLSGLHLIPHLSKKCLPWKSELGTRSDITQKKAEAEAIKNKIKTRWPSAVGTVRGNKQLVCRSTCPSLCVKARNTDP